MTSRALIIAIEDYPDVAEGGMARKLEGTLKGGLAFKQWVEARWQQKNLSEQDTEMIFCSEPQQDLGRGAKRRDILAALKHLNNNGQNMTEELYFYFSGHGFAFVKDTDRSDFIIASDYETAEFSAHCCLNLDKIIFWLRSHLGIGKQFYFIDACRNPMDASSITPSEQVLPFNSNANGEPTTFILQSTITDAVSVVGGSFQKTLAAGLKGKGSAKTWDDETDEAMFVRYDSLRLYLAEKLKGEQPIYNKVEGTAGEKDGLLFELKPVPMIDCHIRVNGASGNEKGEILYRRGRSTEDKIKTIDRLPAKLTLEPDTYKVAVRLENGSVSPVQRRRIELYDTQTLTFDKDLAVTTVDDLIDKLDLDDEWAKWSAPSDFNLESLTGGGARGPRTRSTSRRPRKTKRKRTAPQLYTVDVALPANTTAELRHRSTRKTTVVTEKGDVELRGGKYEVTLRSPDGGVIQQAMFQANADAHELSFAGWNANAAQRSIATHFPQHEDSLQFSEALLDERTEPDLDMWLAMLGAGRILSRDPSTYYKLGQLPLREFWNEQPGSSSIYVLAGFEQPGTRLKVSVSPDKDPNWIDVTRPRGLELWEAYAPVAPGQHYVSFKIDDGICYTVASHAQANRSTLITLIQDANREPQLVQYLLPVGVLTEHLPDLVQQLVSGRNQLDDVRKITRLHRAFRARRDVFETHQDVHLQELLYCKWGNPIGSSLAAYELMRRGNFAMMEEVARNMQLFFSELPDTVAIANLGAATGQHPANGVPLFLDGLRAFPDPHHWLPFPASHLDYSRPWTTWRAVVESDLDPK